MKGYMYEFSPYCHDCATKFGNVKMTDHTEMSPNIFRFFVPCSGCGNDVFGRDEVYLPSFFDDPIGNNWRNANRFLSDAKELVAIFYIAKTLQRLLPEKFSIDFHGFTPGWGYVRYEHKGVKEEKMFRELRDLMRILKLIEKKVMQKGKK